MSCHEEHQKNFIKQWYKGSVKDAKPFAVVVFRDNKRVP